MDDSAGQSSAKEKKQPRLNAEARMDAQLITERTNAIVTENRTSLASGKMGSKAWWKKVDALSKRKERSNPRSDEDSVRERNHYFANLCHNKDYIRLIPMDIM